MVIFLIIIQWLHVFCGIFWFGGTLFLDFVVIPTLNGLPISQQRSFNKDFSKIAARVITPAATLAILLGLVRGVVFGPVNSFAYLFATAYGITFLLGFLAAVATFLWGLLLTSRQALRLNEIPIDEQAAAEGKLPVEFIAQLARVKQLAMLELLGFLAIFTTMILMRFGL
jgi:uncharacterized membrane protein